MKMYKRVVTETFYDAECPKCHTITVYKSSELPFLGPGSLACRFVCPECLHMYEDYEIELKEE